MAENKQSDGWEEVPIDEDSGWEEVPTGNLASRVGGATTKPSALETAIMSGAQGLAFQGADEIVGAARAMADDLGAVGSSFIDMVQGKGNKPVDAPNNYEKYRDQTRAAIQAGEEANPGVALASDIAGGAVSSAVLPGGLLAKGALSGAAMGAGGAEEIEDIPQDAAIGAAIGGAGAKLLPAALTGGAKLAKAARNSLEHIPHKAMLARKAAEQEVKNTATIASRQAVQQLETEAAEKLTKSAERHARELAIKAENAYNDAYKKAIDRGKSVDTAERLGQLVKDKVTLAGERSQERKSRLVKDKLQDKIEKTAKKAYDDSLKASAKAVKDADAEAARAKSMVGQAKDLAKAWDEGDIKGIITKGIKPAMIAAGMVSNPVLAVGALTAKALFKNAKEPLKKAGFHSAKSLAGVGEKSLRALSEAAKRSPNAVMATHHQLLMSNEKYRKAITKAQESE